MGGKGVEDAGDLVGDSGAHQDVADSGEHRSIYRGEVGELHFLEEVDADGVGMTFAGEEDLGEVGGDAELDELAGLAVVVKGESWIRLGGGLAAGDEELVEDAAGEVGEGESGEGATHASTGVAVGEAPDEDLVERSAGDDAELAERRDSAGESPVGDSDAHPALND